MGELEARASRDCIIMEFAAELIAPDDKQLQLYKSRLTKNITLFVLFSLFLCKVTCAVFYFRNWNSPECCLRDV